MKKEIYKDIPENFHRQFCRMLEELEDTPQVAEASCKEKATCRDKNSSGEKAPCKVRASSGKADSSGKGWHYKRYGAILAAAILACASVTAAAVGIMGWHERMSSRFGTEKELEDKLTADHVAVPQTGTTAKGVLEFQALQAVRTDSYFYFLVQMTVPEEIQWNDDILFEECEVSDGEFGCVASFVSNSMQDHTVLLELQLLYDQPISSESRQVRVRLRNLIQTEKTAMTGKLVEGEWEIPLTLPDGEADHVVFYPSADMELGEHELFFPKAEISPFRLRLYTDRDQMSHAAWAHQISLTGVWYSDGTVIKESGLNFSLSGHTDAGGEFCLEFALDNAVDTDKIEGILIEDGGEEKRIFLAPRQIQETARKQAERKEEREQEPYAGFEGDKRISDLRLLYVKNGNAVLADEKTIYLWDVFCGGVKEIFSLEEHGFSWENGGEITLGQASQMLILPYAGSGQVYLYEIAGHTTLTLDAQTFWPWPAYEVYLSNIKDIKELIPDADENYSGQAVASQGSWYYLYSSDGSARNMELKTLEKKSPDA